MSRRFPSAADVRDAVARVRRAIALGAAAPPPEVTAVRWSKGEPGDCAFCGERGPLIAPEEKDGPALCEATVAELFAATRPPRPGAAAEAVLTAVESWAGPPREGEPPPQLPAPSDPCTTCGRAPDAVVDLIAGPDFVLCGDCLAAAAERVDPSVRDAAIETEAHAADLEIDDLERMRVAEGPALIRGNATLALSLLRLLSAPGPGVDDKLVALMNRMK